MADTFAIAKMMHGEAKTPLKKRLGTVGSTVLDGNWLSVLIDGATTPTPVVKCCNAQAGDRVVVLVDGTQWMTIAVVGGGGGQVAAYKYVRSWVYAGVEFLINCAHNPATELLTIHGRARLISADVGAVSDYMQLIWLAPPETGITILSMFGGTGSPSSTWDCTQAPVGSNAKGYRANFSYRDGCVLFSRIYTAAGDSGEWNLRTSFMYLSIVPDGTLSPLGTEITFTLRFDAIR